jgi:succinate dehydrogenase/fumarate reductase cytochrome b subunit
LFMFINFCLMSLFLMNNRKSSSATILNMRNVVESLIVSELFFSTIFLCFFAFVACDFVNWFVMQWKTISKCRLNAQSTSTWSILVFHSHSAYVKRRCYALIRVI